MRGANLKASIFLSAYGDVYCGFSFEIILTLRDDLITALGIDFSSTDSSNQTRCLRLRFQLVHSTMSGPAQSRRARSYRTRSPTGCR